MRATRLRRSCMDLKGEPARWSNIQRELERRVEARKMETSLQLADAQDILIAIIRKELLICVINFATNNNYVIVLYISSLST